MQKEFMVCEAIEFGHSAFSITPERFDTVNVAFAANKLVFAMENSIVIITIKYKAIVSAPTI